MTTNQLLTNAFKVHTARQLVESVNEVANSTYYVFQADQTNNLETVIPDAIDSIEGTQIGVYRDMIQGKRVSSTDLALLVDKNTWSSNTVYDMYEHDVDLAAASFYVSVDEGSYTHVYKCLDNNMSLPSTVQPAFSAISGANTLFYRTSDGYAWKYMYSFTSDDDLKFSTSSYIPIVANNEVITSAQGGVIDVIKITGTGRKYDNYISGSFGVSDIKVGGNIYTYALDDVAADSNSFYNGCLLYLSTGTGAGQNRTVVNYTSNSIGKFVVLDEPFDTDPQNGTTYDLTPQIHIDGTGFESVTAVGRCLVNAYASNSIYRVEMLERGEGYTHYANAYVVADTSVGVQANALLKVILPPGGGHGFDAADELLSNKLEVSVKIANTEGGTVLANNGFRQLGIIKDPLFANVVLTINSTVGVFAAGETVYKISPQLISNSVSVNTTSNLMTVALDSYNNGIANGDMVFIDAITSTFLAYVNNVVNSTTVQLSTNGFFASSNASVYFARPSTYGDCYSTNGVSISLANVYGIFAADDLVCGLSSGGKASVSNVVRSGVSKGFNTFVGMNKYVGSVQSGTFLTNEIVGTSHSNASMFEVSVSNTETAMFVSNQIGIINSGDTIVGANSSATFLVSAKYGPELEFNSGEVIFLENIDRVTRSANTSETFQIIFDF